MFSTGSGFARSCRLTGTHTHTHTHMTHLVLWAMVMLLLASEAVAEGAPEPSCPSFKNERKCHDNGVDCAWCVENKKCVDWDPCNTGKASGCKHNNFTVSSFDRKNASSKCTGTRVFVWILIVLGGLGVLACIGAGVSACCRRTCDPCGRAARRRDYQKLKDVRPHPAYEL